MYIRSLLRSTITLSILLVILVTPALAAPPAAFPGIIPLPDGYRPEGIAVGRGSTFFAGSLGDGSVYGGDLRTGSGGIVVPPQAGRMAVGMAVDERSNFLFVAGGGAGAGYVYDAGSGASLAVYQFTTAPSFVNDVIVTRQAAYFTDSFRPAIYRVPLGPAGALPATATFQEIALGGDFDIVPGAFNTNGIEATSNGRWLVIVQSVLGRLYRVDPATGFALNIDLAGGGVPSGDGILLAGRTLYVVQNFLNQIAVVQLDPGFATGEVVQTITDPAFRIPTTVAAFGDDLYAVNARFDTLPTSTTEYEIVRVSRH